MKCDNCKCTESYIKEYTHKFNIKGQNIEFKSGRRFCKNCDSLMYDPVLDNKASEIAIETYNKQFGIEKERIIELRKKLNLSQELFAKIIGCAKKTLISYEKGTSIPNGCYMIILKSLISDPKVISIILNANKDQFTEKEYNKIIKQIPVSKASADKFKEEMALNEYNGYTKVNKDKIYNMILFFAKKGVLKTKLLKEMFYADFTFYKNNGVSITGLKYAHLPHGPVPDQFEAILSFGEKDKIIDYDIDYQNNYECHTISAKKTFNKKIFNKAEIEVLEQVEKKFEDFNSKDIEEFSHKEKAFTDTEYLSLISYDYSFEMDTF